MDQHPRAQDLLSVLYAAAFFPLTFMRDYVLEKNFGLLTQGLRGWLLDYLKGTLVAAVIGFGKTRKAIVGDTLLEKFSSDEIEFVLAHKLAHHRYHDLWSGVAVASVSLFVTLGLTHAALARVIPIWQIFLSVR